MMEQPRKQPNGLLNFVLDFAPLLIFFVTYRVTHDPFAGTLAFMAAIVVTVIVSLLTLKRVSPMTWISAVLVVGFGGLTVYLHDPKFIQIKPTIIYAGFALLLFGGLVARRPLLKYVFGAMFEGLSDKGWLKLSRNWAWFFAAMAMLNEALRLTLSFDTWLSVKVWGIPLLSLAFAAANVPMLMKNGFNPADPEDEAPIPPASL
jgi:intracellular septation protein